MGVYFHNGGTLVNNLPYQARVIILLPLQLYLILPTKYYKIILSTFYELSLNSCNREHKMLSTFEWFSSLLPPLKPSLCFPDKSKTIIIIQPLKCYQHNLMYVRETTEYLHIAMAEFRFNMIHVFKLESQNASHNI